MIEKTDGYYVVRFPETRASSAMEIHVKEDYLYTKDHLWVDFKGISIGRYKIGIAPLLARFMDNLYYIELYSGEEFKQNEIFGYLENPAQGVYLPMPWNGTVMDPNPDLRDAPELITTNPYEEWMVILFLYNFDYWTNLNDNGLMDAAHYAIYAARCLN